MDSKINEMKGDKANLILQSNKIHKELPIINIHLNAVKEDTTNSLETGVNKQSIKQVNKTQLFCFTNNLFQ